jgi:hypothetical protein
MAGAVVFWVERGRGRRLQCYEWLVTACFMEADSERQIDRKVDGWHGCLRVVERRDGLWQSSLFHFFFFFFAFDMLQPPNFFTGQELNSKAFPSPLLIFSI